jgi:hypothetical protein
MIGPQTNIENGGKIINFIAEILVHRGQMICDMDWSFISVQYRVSN